MDKWFTNGDIDPREGSKCNTEQCPSGAVGKIQDGLMSFMGEETNGYFPEGNKTENFPCQDVPDREIGRWELGWECDGDNGWSANSPKLGFETALLEAMFLGSYSSRTEVVAEAWSLMSEAETINLARLANWDKIEVVFWI